MIIRCWADLTDENKFQFSYSEMEHVFVLAKVTLKWNIFSLVKPALILST